MLNEVHVALWSRFDSGSNAVENGCGRLDDFSDLPASAVAQALSRLRRQGMLERLSKGVYYRARKTSFGKSLPNPIDIQKLASRRKQIFPTGIATRRIFSASHQTARRSEVALSALSLPRKLIGGDTVTHARRPEAWAGLSEADAALLDFCVEEGKRASFRPRKLSEEP